MKGRIVVKETLSALLNTLNAISVSGKENMNRLLGCIMTVESLMQLAETCGNTAEKEERHDLEAQEG